MTTQSGTGRVVQLGGILAVLLCAPIHNAHAQADWLGTAKNILNSVTGKTAQNPSAQTPAQNAGPLTQADMAAGLRDALRVGTVAVVQKLGASDGFHLDPTVHIPLPQSLQTVDKALSAIGMASVGDDLELRLNRAAEAATPRAKELFLSAIQKMTIADARAILSSNNSAATDYLRRTMGEDLERDITPIVTSAMSQVGAVQAFDKMADQYRQIPVAGRAIPRANVQLTGYVVQKTMDGIFYYVAQEEAAIRADPAKRTTDILKRVFGVGQN